MVNNHRTRHAQIVMKRADVRKSPRIRKSDPEACHAEGRLREPKPFLRRRDDEPRVSAVGSGIDDGVPGPVRIERDVWEGATRAGGLGLQVVVCGVPGSWLAQWTFCTLLILLL